ncbi:MAG: GNAT family N-acetyltransferase [Gammaproteobacteria bacterium]|nr:GNAT family N-acetyltransferase [Gammaproteobacteria bacterium]
MRTSFVSEAITLRRFTPTDAPHLYTAVRESLRQIGRWLPWCHPDYSIGDSEEWLALCDQQWNRGAEYAFAITDAAGGQLLGSVGINQLNPAHKLGQLGYWVRASRTRHGVASAATKLAASFGFSELHLTRIEIVALIDNLASRRVAEKVGATFECVARNRLVLRGRPHDAAVYSLVPSDIR